LLALSQNKEGKRFEITSDGQKHEKGAMCKYRKATFSLILSACVCIARLPPRRQKTVPLP
jgi:hypothetical protein